MLNPFTLKKYGALLIMSLAPCICFFVGIKFYSLWWGIGALIGSSLLAMFISVRMLNNPFTAMLEGKGLLVIKEDSTGVLRPFLMQVHQPYIKGYLDGVEVNDVFDRAAVQQIAAPRENTTAAYYNCRGGVDFSLDEQELNANRFALFHWPVLIWNDQLKSFITKDFMAEKEKWAFAEHGIIYLNRKVEELTTAVRDFGRYVVEMTKPKTESFFGSKWFFIIAAVIGVILIGILVGKPVYEAITSSAGAATGAVKGVASGAISPR